MILLDYSAVAIANISVAIAMNGEQITKEFVLHHILNSIRSYIFDFKKEYGRMIVCCDSRRNWRKDIFPYYKVKRKSSKEKSDLNWDLVYEHLDFVKNELRECFPVNVIEIENSEADDIIGVLSQYATTNSMKSVIVSNDKDFYQRHSKYVSQWRPCEGNFKYVTDPQKYLKELIIRGDSSDGIPNIKSQDDIFTIEGKKQKSIFQRDIDVWLEDDTNSFLTEEWKVNFDRNNRLINLDFTPDDIKENVINTYISQEVKVNTAKMTKFFMKHGLKDLHKRMNDFI